MKKINSAFALLLMISLLAGGEIARAQSMGKQTVAMLEESPAGSKILRFVKAVNKGEAIPDDFIKLIFHEDLIAKAGLAGLKNMMENDIPENDGKLTLYLVERVERFKFVLYAKGSKSPGWLKMDFTHKGSSPYKIVGVGVDGIDEAPERADKPMKID
ncbi:MAG: hypothetical protein HEP71_25395 [Roseivirga sp.]|nr:hypothetical protein [Roseivirga sp.]